jgi:hypothetical protein
LFWRWWVSKTAIVLFLFLCSPALFAVDLETPSSAEFCGDCHRAIYDGWKRSAHANAMESRLFQDALKLAESDYGVQSRKVCLSCHSPIAVMTGDLKLIKKVSWEGVTCDYCHSIRDVTMTNGNPWAKVEFSLVKSGPSKDAVSTAHGTAYSAIFTSPLACVTCHEYRNSLGFAVLTTYSEWKKSSYTGEGESCQSCHMYRVKGDVVDPRVKRGSRLTLNLHEIPGSHSLDQLNKAIKAQLSAVRQGDQVQVTVKVSNHGAGHDVPTGSPLRQLILEVRADRYDGKHFRQERVFKRTVADQQGKIINREHVAFLRAARVVKDTRLAPNETRNETFTFPAPRGVQTQVEADFSYYYSPMASTAAQQQVKFLTLRRLVP